MPHDPARIADTKSWLTKAFELTAVPPFLADIVFHAQQCAEKALKGYLAWHDIPFRKTQDLAEIGRQCAETDPSLEPLLVRAARLTAYAWKYRYPGEPEEPTAMRPRRLWSWRATSATRFSRGFRRKLGHEHVPSRKCRGRSPLGLRAGGLRQPQTMDEVLAREVARTLECHLELLPFLPELLADLDALGTDPEDVLDLLRPLGLPPGGRALDLGCGKGAVAFALAEELGLGVRGIDAFPPFVEEARRRAAERGLTDRCSFECADLRAAAAAGGEHDLVLLLGLGPVWGEHASTVGALRRTVRPGGYLVLGDAYLEGDAARGAPGYEGYADHEETLRRLTTHGDRLLREVATRHKAEWDAQTEAIRRRAEGLARRHPGRAELFRRYVARQEHEVRLLSEAAMPVLWLLQRPPSD
jgi:2-polyprenyl-3-methyl-5-hydroxy-6-metoxy-1,4-benzoquinol methylase/HEPN domain-containing protein